MALAASTQSGIAYYRRFVGLLDSGCCIKPGPCYSYWITAHNVKIKDKKARKKPSGKVRTKMGIAAQHAAFRTRRVHLGDSSDSSILCSAHQEN